MNSVSLFEKQKQCFFNELVSHLYFSYMFSQRIISFNLRSPSRSIAPIVVIKVSLVVPAIAAITFSALKVKAKISFLLDLLFVIKLEHVYYYYFTYFNELIRSPPPLPLCFSPASSGKYELQHCCGHARRCSEYGGSHLI